VKKKNVHAPTVKGKGGSEKGNKSSRFFSLIQLA
jgi:hypothetical protein